MTAIPYWMAATRMWGQKIGYAHDRKGQRVRKTFYWSGAEGEFPPPEAIADSVQKQKQWARIVEGWNEVAPALEELSPDNDWSQPVWYRPELYAWPLEMRDDIIETNERMAKLEVREHVQALGNVTKPEILPDVLQSLRAAGILPKSIIAPSRQITIRQAIVEYLQAQKARTFLKVGKRIDTGTYNTKRNNLLLSVGCNISQEWQQEENLLDLEKPILAMEGNDLEGLANHWFTLPRGLERRTVKNYLDGFKGFLDWCDTREEYGFRKPRNANEILHINGAGTTPVTETDYPALAAILKDAPERTKMYALLGLLCGFYQTDICEIQSNEVHVKKEQTFITRYRSKESSEAKQSSRILVTHWIPPEVARWMMQFKASPNEWRLFFLNRYNRPMFHERLEAGKSNAVSKAWEKALVGQKKLNFKQLRKWGWNEIQRFAGNDICQGETLSKRWAGQSGGGVSASYRFEDYGPVIRAEKQWWAAIKKKVGL